MRNSHISATNLSFQYNMSLYNGNFTLNHKTGVAEQTEQDRSKMCSRIQRATYYATDVRYI